MNNFKTVLSLDSSQHDSAIKKSGEEVKSYGKKVNDASQDVRKLIEQQRKAKKQYEANQKALHQYGLSVSDFKNQISGTIKGFVGFSAAAAALTSALKYNIETAAKFEKSLSGLRALTGLGGDDLKYLKDKAIELGSTTTQSASEVVEAFKLIGSQKPELLKSKEALASVTKAAITLSEAAGIEMTEAAKALTMSLNQMGDGASMASEYINILAAGSKEGAADIPYLTKAIEKCGSIAASSNIKFNQLVGIIEAVAPKFSSADVAGSQLNSTLLKLSTQTNNNFKPSVVGLSQAIDNLAKAELNDKQIKDLVGESNVSMVKAIIAAREEIDKMTVAITGTNTAEEQAKINTDNFEGSVKNLKSAWEGFNLMLNESNNILKKMVDNFAETLRIAGYIAKYGFFKGISNYEGDDYFNNGNNKNGTLSKNWVKNQIKFRGLEAAQTEEDVKLIKDKLFEDLIRAKKSINTSGWNQTRKDALTKAYMDAIDYLNEQAAARVESLKIKPSGTTNTNTTTSAKTTSSKTQNEVETAQKNYTKTINKLNQQLKDGVITQKEYDKGVENADKSFYDVLSANMDLVKKSKVLSLKYKELVQKLKSDSFIENLTKSLTDIEVVGRFTNQSELSILEKQLEETTKQINEKIENNKDNLDAVKGELNDAYKTQERIAKDVKRIKDKNEYESIKTNDFPSVSDFVKNSINDFVNVIINSGFARVSQNGYTHVELEDKNIEKDKTGYFELLKELVKLTGDTHQYFQKQIKKYSGTSRAYEEMQANFETKYGNNVDDIVSIERKKRSLQTLDPRIGSDDYTSRWNEKTLRYEIFDKYTNEWGKMNADAEQFADIFEGVLRKMDAACTLVKYMFEDPLIDVEDIRKVLESEPFSKKISFDVDKNKLQLVRDALDSLAFGNIDEFKFGELKDEYQSILSSGFISASFINELINAVDSPYLKNELSKILETSFDLNSFDAVRLGDALRNGIKNGKIKEVVYQQIIDGIQDPKLKEKLQEGLDLFIALKTDANIFKKNGYDIALQDFKNKKEELEWNNIGIVKNDVDTVVGLANAYHSLFETLDNADADGWDIFNSVYSTIQNTIDAVNSLCSSFREFFDLQKTFNQLTEEGNKLTEAAVALGIAKDANKKQEIATTNEATAANVTETASELALTSAESSEAIAGATSSGAKLPFPYNLSAIAAGISAVVGALSIVGSFANGGVIQGSSVVGDHNLARVNSGEMIINGSQQDRLWKIISGEKQMVNQNIGGEVKFRIEGQQLVGVLTNYNKKFGKIL